MVDIKALLKYNGDIRHKYFKSFKSLPWKEFTKNREASFHSMRNIFVHTLEAINYWLDFLQEEKLCSEKAYNEYKTFEDINAYMRHVEKRTQKHLGSLTKENLNKKYKVKGEDDKTMEITAEDVLIHVFEEEVHHRGELNALLWQMGIDPSSMGWKEL